MKKISLMLIIVLLLGLFSCKNEKFEFPDYSYSTVYFPYQYPIRTLVLGDYETDNTSDNNLIFIISAHIGGMYNNTKNQTADFEIVPSLAQNVMTSLKDSLKLLPSSYYTLNPLSQLIIPKDSFYGGFKVQLTDAFLNDTMAYRKYYILPVRITASSLDSILSGSSLVANPDPRINSNWRILPKNFTLYGIKFINPYHGKYLHRGRSIKKDLGLVPIDTVIYRTQYVEQNEIWALMTNGRYKVTVTGVVRSKTGSPGTFKMNLTFNTNGDCIITTATGSAFTVAGTGKFVKDGDEWGNKKRNAIQLSYDITSGTNIFSVKDTLVIRDRDVRYEDFVPVIY